MKRTILILSVLALLLSLAACSGAPAPIQTEPAKPAQTDALPAETGSDGPAATEPTDPEPAGTPPIQTDPVLPAETQASGTVPPETQVPETVPPETEPAPPEPLTLVDNDVCTVQVLRMGEDDIWGFQVFLRLENKTDTTILFSAENCTVQGWFIDPGWVTQVDPGQIKESDFNIFQNFYERCGISHVEECRFRLLGKDLDHYSAAPLVDEEIALYPTGKTADEIEHAEREPLDTDILIAGDDRFSVVLVQVDPDGFWGYTWDIYLENRTEEPLTFNWKELEINGVSFEPYWLAGMPAGLKGYAQLTVSRDSLREKNIEDPVEFDFLLNVYNAQTYDDIFEEHRTVVIR